MHALLFTNLNCVSFSPCIVLCKFLRFCTKRKKGILYLQNPPIFSHKSQNQNFKKASVLYYTFTFIHIKFSEELQVLKSRSSLICYRDIIGVKEFGCIEVVSILYQLNHFELIPNLACNDVILQAQDIMRILFQTGLLLSLFFFIFDFI